MSLFILNSHTGSSYGTNPSSYSTLDELRSWISRKSGIQASYQILMTARGKPVKPQTISIEQEIFLYDRSILASAISASKLLPSEDDIVSSFVTQEPPEHNRLETLQEIWETSKKRREWALSVSSAVKGSLEKIKRYERELRTVQRATAIAVENIRQHIENLKPKYEETKEWADQTSEDQASVLAEWKPRYEMSGSVSVEERFTRCLVGGDLAVERARARGAKGNVVLQDYVAREDLDRANAVAKASSSDFRPKLQELQSLYRNTTAESQELIETYRDDDMFLDSGFEDEATRLFEEVEVLAKKIGSDYNSLLETVESKKALSQASKVAQTHKNNFIPSILQTKEELAQLGQQILQRKQSVIRSSTQYLQHISRIESTVSATHSKLAKLDIDPKAAKAFLSLDQMIRLPSNYGLCLIEYVRRYEFVAIQVSKEESVGGSALAYKDEEMKRRSKWQASMQDAMRFTDEGELSLTRKSGSSILQATSRLASREDIQGYLEQLRSTDGLRDAFEEVSEAVKVLDATPKEQVKVSKAFKMGSVHEANLCQSSATLPRNNENVQDLQRERSKVDEKLRCVYFGVI